MRRRGSVVTTIGSTLLLSACLFGGDPPPPPTTAQNLSAEGLRRLARGDLQGAETSFQQALAEAELQDDLVGQGEVWNNLGVLARLRSDTKTAVDDHRRALMLHELAANPSGRARTHQHLGAVHLAEGRTAEATKAFRDALRIWTEQDDDLGIARAEVGLAATALREKRANDALALATQAEERADGTDDKDTLAAARSNRAAALEALGRRDAAREAYLQALTLDRERESPRAMALDLAALATLEAARGDRVAACHLTLREARLYRRLELVADARAALKRALDLARAAKRDDLRAEATRILSELPVPGR